MYLPLDKKYDIEHAWYEKLLEAFALISKEPKAQKLHFKPDERRIIVEIGVYEGASSCWWSDNFLDHPESRLFSIDPFTGNEEYQENRDKFPTLDKIELIARTNIAKSKNAGKVTVIKGCSWNVFPTVAAELDGQIDVLYIDGEHTTNALCRDISLYYPLLKSGGALIFDDYGHEDVRKGVMASLDAFGDLESVFCSDWQLWCIKR